MALGWGQSLDIIVKPIIIYTLRINAKCTYGIRPNQRQIRVRYFGVRFLTEPCLFSLIDAVRKPHLPGSVNIFSDITITASSFL